MAPARSQPEVSPQADNSVIAKSVPPAAGATQLPSFSYLRLKAGDESAQEDLVKGAFFGRCPGCQGRPAVQA